MSHLYCQCVECKPPKTEIRLQEILGCLECNNFLRVEGGNAHYRETWHCNCEIKKLQKERGQYKESFYECDKKRAAYIDSETQNKELTERLARLEKVLSHREMQLGISFRECDTLRDALRLVSNAYGCFAGCTGNLPGAPSDGSGHTEICRACREVLKL